MTCLTLDVKSSVSKPAILNRYTSLPVALDVLSKRRITLLTRETWEDENDAYYLERYHTELKLRSLLAICFSRREIFGAVQFASEAGRRAEDPTKQRRCSASYDWCCHSEGKFRGRFDAELWDGSGQ
jgi:hypothetical protein